MTELLKLSGQEFKINMINMLRVPLGTRTNEKCEYRDCNSNKNTKEMPEIFLKNVVD